MAIEFTFRSTKDEIHVRDREAGFDRPFKDRVAMHNKRGLIVAPSKPEEAMEAC